MTEFVIGFKIRIIPQGDFKKMELTWGTAESEAKNRSLWRTRNGSIIPNGQKEQKKKKRRKK